ncbi:unnamed protein product, partial [Polarella glacialis]
MAQTNLPTAMCSDAGFLPEHALVQIDGSSQPRPLGKVHAGQRLLCYDHELGRPSYATLTKCSRSREPAEWLTIALGDDSRFQMTKDHLVQCYEGDRLCHCRASELTPGRHEMISLQLKSCSITGVSESLGLMLGLMQPRVSLAVYQPDRFSIFVSTEGCRSPLLESIAVGSSNSSTTNVTVKNGFLDIADSSDSEDECSSDSRARRRQRSAPPSVSSLRHKDDNSSEVSSSGSYSSRRSEQVIRMSFPPEKCPTGNCLPENALVQIEGTDDPQPLSKVHVGQRLLCYDHLSDKPAYSTVTNCSCRREPADWIAITLEGGSQLAMTKDHAIQCYDNGRMVRCKAAELQQGQHAVLRLHVVRRAIISVSRASVSPLRSVAAALEQASRFSILLATEGSSSPLIESVAVGSPNNSMGIQVEDGFLEQTHSAALESCIARIGPDSSQSVSDSRDSASDQSSSQSLSIGRSEQ